MNEELHKNCKFLSVHGRYCTALKELYCKTMPTKRCAFYKEATVEELKQKEEPRKRQAKKRKNN